jgi:hypothetical protein
MVEIGTPLAAPLPIQSIFGPTKSSPRSVHKAEEATSMTRIGNYQILAVTTLATILVFAAASARAQFAVINSFGAPGEASIRRTPLA